MLGRQAAAVCSAGSLDLVPPGATPADAAYAGFGARRILRRGDGVIVFGVPIHAPFVHIVSDVEKTVTVRTPFSHSFGSCPFALKVLYLIWWLISPGIVCTFETAAARLLPLGFCGQSEGIAQCSRQPFAVRYCGEPAHTNDWLSGLT